jgi:protein TonB
MSTSVLTFSAWENDTPWRRLYWTFPTAVAIWVAILWSFAIFMGNSNERLPEPPAIDAQMIELAEPTQTVNTPPEKLSRPTPPIVIPQPGIEKTAPPSPVEKPVIEPTTTTQISPKALLTPSQEPNKTTNNATQNIGAKAIYRPIPQIPDELRQDALSASAVARFHVAIDGTTTVELIKPTANPKLNRLLLSTLKNWKFFPSMKDGKPAASTEEIVIKVEVK